MAKKTKKTEDLDRLCWHCNTKLLYGGEHDTSQEDEFYESVTYMGCPECGTHVEIYKAKKNIDSYEAKSKRYPLIGVYTIVIIMSLSLKGL